MTEGKEFVVIWMFFYIIILKSSDKHVFRTDNKLFNHSNPGL